MKDYIYEVITDKARGKFSEFFRAFFYLLSLIYGLMVNILIFIRGSFKFRPSCKVISVGNITWGGTGKTPLVSYIASLLNKGGRKVAIISRGYKQKGSGGSDLKDYGRIMGDEPYMLQKRLAGIPVIVDRKRKRSIIKAVSEFGVDTVILDDGFQQWGIKKDLEVVTIDAVNPFGNGFLLPRGILRQPLSTLKAADIFVLTKTDLVSDLRFVKLELARINPDAMIIESVHNPKDFFMLGNEAVSLGIDTFKGRTAALFCAIGDPDSFKDVIQKIGVKIGVFFRFRDHHKFSQDDLDNIIHEAKRNRINTLITTEKDAVRLEGLSTEAEDFKIYVLRIDLKTKDNEQGFDNRLFGLYTV